ncbi:SDR family NAD(P)-dependent oxidoreductase [Ferrimonas lipolytica]|uniref:SDR family NAD(P)-dependent oxidoreductase n=1 Tax=Ferrimonas lipolytica TaxID=2724191 RepID=A0A6H1U9T1_9GAMM|nr:SDR family NAD(P)-dependent oxidoreductase [Ferrimonas lipolytica]QIZ75801.1 SDR family NAD(P)-dependent oxidoreductase [Ferrimonas lipolytica]
MTKVILITGSTDGIGFETAKMVVSQGHHVLIHGRSPAKLERVVTELSQLAGAGTIESHACDLSSLAEVSAFADLLTAKYGRLDVLINNAGVYKVPEITTSENLDVRFVVNTIAPFLLTTRLLPLLDQTGRIINLSSAAQAPVNLNALVSDNAGSSDSAVYAQSKLALTMWSVDMAQKLGNQGPAVIAVNPASFLGSKLVKEAYGVAGNDLQIGADILYRAALADEFANASGKYFDNDAGQFRSPHADASNAAKNAALVAVLERTISPYSN